VPRLCTEFSSAVILLPVSGRRKVSSNWRMRLNWANIAIGILGIYIFYAPFAYKYSRQKGSGHVQAFFYTILMYVLFFLWIAGAAETLYGIGMVIDAPTEICGSGCVEEGKGHWEHPQPDNLMVGLGLMAGGWIIGKMAEKHDGM